MAPLELRVYVLVSPVRQEQWRAGVMTPVPLCRQYLAQCLAYGGYSISGFQMNGCPLFWSSGHCPLPSLITLPIGLRMSL